MSINIQNKAKLLDRIDLTDSAKQVLSKRNYLLKDKYGKPREDIIDMFKRVAENIASADKLYGSSPEEIDNSAKKFFDHMVNLEFLSGMALRNAGRALQQLSACYVLPIKDSMDSIYTTLKDAAFLHKTGAGVGYDFSRLRPNNDLVTTTSGKASGPLSFMKLYDYSTETIVNNASTRRGGNMGILRIDHPDIVEFIKSKEDNKQLNNFNISVSITDDFMTALKNNTDYNLINPNTKQTVQSIPAKEMFDLIVDKAWNSAEPGIIFIDTVNKYNQTPGVGRIEATNLCGEQPLLAYEACNLGSIVLSKMLKKNSSGKYEMDYDKLANLIKNAVHFLDNSIDVNKYPLPEIDSINKRNRKIGLGLMGVADTFYYLGIPYNSNKGLEFAEKIMNFISKTARNESSKLAIKRGSFPNFSKSIWPKKGYSHMRNATTTTIAPNGTTSIFARSSSGIEPNFALVYVRKNIMDFGKDEFIEVNPVFEQLAKDRWIYSRDLMKKIASAGTIAHLSEIPDDLKEVFVTAHDIEPEWHIKMQAAFQKHTDNAVSKTVNLPNTASKEDVRKIFLLAHETGCKGVTIYRDQSRDKQVLNLKK